MNKLTDDQILALAANAIGHETCGVFAIDRGNYYALDGSALIAIGRAAIAAHEASLAAPATDPICEAPPPSLELVVQWLAEIWHEGTPVKVALSDMHIATRAAQWGAALLREHLSAKAEDPITPQELNTLWVASNPPEDRLRLVEDLAADAVAGMRYIEQSHGRLYGVGWDRVYKKADILKPTLDIYPEPSNE